MTLYATDFAAFHREVHGTDPFRWQQRLLEHVIDRGWPSLLDLPTGAGKTTCVDIALFALALDAGARQRRQPCRIAMVVDRRVVVDQVAERGRKLLAALNDVSRPIASEVSAALRSLCGAADDDEPLGVYTLRGGMPKDDGWARDPSRPLILASTVDQVGSRLLIQGYGVSDCMRPVHAGLVGNDMLLLLDEVHLSQPFADTLQQIAHLRGRWHALPSRFHAAFLSATPGLQVAGEVFRLDDAERGPDQPIGRRLHAHKRTTLVEATGRTDLEQKVVGAAREFANTHRTIAAIVNRVASARVVARNLRDALGANGDVVLLTGRMRPLDRDDVVRGLRPRVESGRKRNADDRPLVVVATQCIEAGADFDFDAMVSECASLDALRQRFGRVDRLGEYARAEGCVVHDKAAKPDPIYGKSAAATWKWLHDHANGKAKTVDFGTAHLDLPGGDELGALVAEKPSAPVLLPAYVDLWMQSSPRPQVVPEPSLWLHGPKAAPADVQVVWRADLSEQVLASRDNESAVAVVSAVRPSSLEALPVPFAQARRWLLCRGSNDVADVEGSPDGERVDREGGRSRVALRWCGDESEVITADDLRPGDTIVVPSARGGIGECSFDPDETAPVTDLAERAMLMARGWPMLRLHPNVLAGLPIARAEALLDLEDDDLRPWLECAAEAASATWQRLWLQALSRARRPFPVEAGGEDWQVLRGPRLSPTDRRLLRESGSDSCEDGVELTSDDDDSYHAGRPVTLDEHSGDVESFARRYARAAGLDAALVQDIALAGYLHDVGKADPRFQLLLRGGDEVDLEKAPDVWAKSGMPPEAKAAHRLAARRSGYPRGARHEVMSVAMIENARALVAKLASDPELVLHLVGSHHGYCRPFAPAVEDREPRDVALDHEARRSEFGPIRFGPVSSANELHRLDSPLAGRFWGLVEKFGWWGLCWLEALLRLADHRASEMEQEKS